MDDQRIGAALRAIRIRKGWRQSDVALRARVSTSLVGAVERGGAAVVTLDAFDGSRQPSGPASTP
jgi:transcriptional regulator with XRE-family HTH domain